MNGEELGIDRLKAGLLQIREAFPCQHYEMLDQISVGSRVVIRWTWTGTHRDEWRFPVGPIAPTGRRFSVGGVETFEIARGKMSGVWIYYDLVPLLDQLGVALRAS